VCLVSGSAVELKPSKISLLIDLSSLIALHQHDMFFNGALDASHAIDPSSRHFLAMQVLTRMLRDIAVTLTAKDANVHLMPPFEIYVVYLSIVLHIKVGDRGNSEDWKAELQHIVDYLRVLQKKWKSARKYGPNLICCHF
jgi:hypothetical protein